MSISPVSGFANSDKENGLRNSGASWNRKKVFVGVLPAPSSVARQARFDRIRDITFDRCFNSSNLSDKVSADLAIRFQFGSKNPDVDVIYRLVSKVKDKRILRSLFMQILKEPLGFSNEQKATLVELFLHYGDISHENMRILFVCKSIMSYMDRNFLISLYVSSKSPFESLNFIDVIGLDRCEEVLIFCLKNRFAQSINILVGKMPNESLRRVVAELLRHQKDQVFTSMKLLPQSLFFQEKDQFFAYFTSLTHLDLRKESNVELAKTFFGSKDISAYLLSSDPDPAVDHMKSAFSVAMADRSLVPKDVLESVPYYASTLFTTDHAYVSDAVTRLLLDEDLVLNSMILHFIDCLSIDTIHVLDARLTKMSQKGGSSAEYAQVFLDEAKYEHILLWKRSAGYEHLQNLPFIAKGTQVDKDGEIDEAEATDIVEHLNVSSPSSMWFSQLSLAKDLVGGVCSAMTFRALRLLRDQSDQSSTLTKIKKIEPDLIYVKQEYRTIQAAYNTIGRIDESQPFNASFDRDKMESLLKQECPNQTIVSSSEQFIQGNADTTAKIAAHLCTMPLGQYIVRSICPLDPTDPDYATLHQTIKAKGEQYGHTTLLIKESNATYYYDPTLGFMHLTHPEQLPMILAWEHARWNLPQTTLYQISN
jgi:hypothetical protein